MATAVRTLIKVHSRLQRAHTAIIRAPHSTPRTDPSEQNQIRRVIFGKFIGVHNATLSPERLIIHFGFLNSNFDSNSAWTLLDLGATVHFAVDS